jgi:L-threonylcarbamoyladenylate synthase
MKTRITRSAAVAAGILREGGIVAFPTETVYGLGADAFNSAAIQKIYKAKGRPADNPLIVHVGNLELINQVARRIPLTAEKLIETFFPGPLTVIVPRGPRIPLDVTAGLDTVGIRFPMHPVAQQFLAKCHTPVAAPSANRSGRPSATTWMAAARELHGRIPCILKGGPSRVGLESTVIDCTARRPIVLRQGAVTLEQLREVLPDVRSSDSIGSATGAARSPGMKYRHYSPEPEVILIEKLDEIPSGVAGSSAFIGLERPEVKKKLRLAMTCREVPEYARKLFHFFRACEKAGVRKIYCQCVPEIGLGRALMDRLRRAACDLPRHS